MPLSKNKIKYVRSLADKKGRRQQGAFVAEGPKAVGDLMEALQPLLLIHTPQWKAAAGIEAEDITVSEEELRKVSFLQHPQDVLAVFPLMETTDGRLDTTKLSLALDGVQDPGNVGTIVRIADWFGITDIFCSPDTADIFNPKVVQATMGSLARIHVCYTDLRQLTATVPDDYPIYVTALDGADIYSAPLTANGLIVMGNEGKGVSEAMRNAATRLLRIPSYPPGRATADSLNVAVATAIVCSVFRKQ